ncbi:DUF5703 domain-containing protein [Dyadobacter fermentans]|uniref:DUF5703 domain-containing protein n=1 Tax=Dyadobacter fermentans (strain ATCC 700827 / DSM 18053 / CIP 107007 / KCTC 52180 / NS114) TaxID=471854 RepID=C6VYL4_DYAFD|nr:DUF5703 domain-containing protein [Dyadobacter fermentans]ACT93369.1 conserved hypothetical protein [Dyadobacter fermentans DSM 18053]
MPLIRFYRFVLVLLLLIGHSNAFTQDFSPEQYNLKWDTQSKNSGESMPCGGGDVGLNVWVENGDLLFYVSRSGIFDENNVMPKLGRVRVRLSPNPFDNGESFQQELKLNEGYVAITGKKGKLTAKLKVWVDVFSPVIHVEAESSAPVAAQAWYESWRTGPGELKGNARSASSYKWAAPKIAVFPDSVRHEDNGVLFYHQNRDSTIFDVIVSQQKLDAVKPTLWNPLKNLTYGGWMGGPNMVADPTVANGKYADAAFRGFGLKTKSTSKNIRLSIYLHTDQQPNVAVWKKALWTTVVKARKVEKLAHTKTIEWWKQYWQRSHIALNADKKDSASAVWQVGRNYQLFRYMLGCNAFGSYPTKFNGGLFTYDPVFVDTSYHFSADHRNWGGGIFTAQNQRLVYWPMLKSGDFDMMKPQFEFYQRILGNAETRTQHYWGHNGASFTEQIENFGLPNYAEYSSKRPEGFDPGLEYNKWLEYLWDTSLEFCLMILDQQHFTGADISAYLPLIESCVVFFDEHYQYLAARRSAAKLDQNGHLVLFPGSAAETYKMAYNSVTTVAGLKTVLERMLALPAPYGSEAQRTRWKEMQRRIPPISFREMQGHRTIAPAQAWERIQNTEIPQLYPVYPYGMYGIGKPDLETAVNTWKYDTEAIKNRNHTSWHQDGIFCARLGLTDEAAALTIKKLQDSGRRFPAFWGPGHDWVPDHNWGGSGMIGLQEMLMQTHGDSIYILPAWPDSWDVRFKLHAPKNTVVEGEWKGGKMVNLKVTPVERRGDLICSKCGLSDIKR